MKKYVPGIRDGFLVEFNGELIEALVERVEIGKVGNWVSYRWIR